MIQQHHHITYEHKKSFTRDKAQICGTYKTFLSFSNRFSHGPRSYKSCKSFLDTRTSHLCFFCWLLVHRLPFFRLHTLFLFLFHQWFIIYTVEIEQEGYNHAMALTHVVSGWIRVRVPDFLQNTIFPLNFHDSYICFKLVAAGEYVENGTRRFMAWYISYLTDWTASSKLAVYFFVYSD